MDEQENMKNKKSSGSSKMNSILKDILISGISMRSTSISFCHSGNMVNVYSKGANSTVKLTEIERPDFGEILTYLEVLLQSSLNGMTTPVRKKVKLKLGTEAHLFQFLFAPTKPVSLNINILDHQATGHSLSSLSLSNKHVEAIKRALTEHHGLTIVSAPANSCLDKIGGAILNFLSLEERKVLYFGTEETRELTGMSQVTVGVEHTLPETAFSAATLKTFLDSNYDNIVSVAPLSEDALKRLVNIALSETNTTIFIESNDCLSSFMAVKKTGVSTSSLIEACKFIINVREVKGVCPFCKETFIITKEQLPPNLQTANQLINIKAYRGKGCKLCKNTGISGKTLVFETMEVDSEQIDIDMLTRTQKPLKKFLLESGLLQPLIKEARRSLMNGRITFDEFINLVSPR
jgi:type IV pilus assembly protein PilB